MYTNIEDFLNELYRVINQAVFAGELPDLPVIVETGKPYKAVCRSSNNKPVGICISLDRINRSDVVEDITGTVLHEMVHVYCIIHDIPHFDRSTGEHLPGFVQAAEEHGLYYDDFMNTNILLLDAVQIVRAAGNG